MHTKMHYRRFGRTGLRMPVLTCGGMRFQHKWSDEDPAVDSRRTTRPISRPPSGAPSSSASTTSRPPAATAPPRCSSGASSLDPARGAHRPDQGRPGCHRKRSSSIRSTNRWITSGSTTSICSPSTASITKRSTTMAMRKGGSLEAARKMQAQGRVRFIGFSTHAPCRIDPAHDRHRRVRLRQSPLVFRQRFQLAGHPGSRPARHGRLHHQPQ